MYAQVHQPPAGGGGGNPQEEEIRVEGVVYALPGLYGPHGPNSSGDTLPIVARNGVHLQGLGARRVVIRGGGTNLVQNVFWPTSQPSTAVSFLEREVLMDLSQIHRCGGLSFPADCQNPPSDPDAVEFIDGFTFQGGDVQVRVSNSPYNRDEGQKAVLTNCLFDMRHEWVDEVSGNTVFGPYIGILLSKHFVDNGSAWGYVDQQILIANNTFIMARRGVAQVGGTAGWVDECRDEAVGILDASNPGCGALSGGVDCDDRVRGLGSAGIMNNVFRTRELEPNATKVPFAMLGIDQSDTRVAASGSGPLVSSNAFAAARNGAGGTNGYFYSDAVVPLVSFPANPSLAQDALLHCSTSTYAQQPPYDCGSNDPLNCPTSNCALAVLPTPLVDIYDGPAANPGVDPGFIGEYLGMTVAGLEDYVDWRLLPGTYPTASPLKDAGYIPSGDTITMENGTSFTMPDRDEISPFDWDGEHYGNPRGVDGAIDIGFDEVHLFSMAGSYGNHSNSHNNPGSMNLLAPQGKVDRYAFVRQIAGGITLVQGNQIKLHGTLEEPAYPSSGILPAWTQPPAVLTTPLVNTSMPADYRTKYITFNNQGSPPPPTPFTENLTLSSFISGWRPLGPTHPSEFEFILMTPPNSLGLKLSDDEGTDHAYFNTQALILSAPGGGALLRGNLQVEYR